MKNQQLNELFINFAYIFSDRVDVNDPTLEDEDVYFCSECDTPMDKDKGVCSIKCHESSMR